MPNEKRSAKTGRERRLWFGHSHLGARDLCSVAAYEMIHRVRWRKGSNRWQHAERIAREENHIGWMARDTGNFRVLNELNRICATSVLRDARVGVIDITILVEHHVFEHGAKAQSLKNIRLVLGREVDRLCVAAAFNVEDAFVAPNVFVVSNKMTLRICRQGGFSSAAKTEEQGGDAGLFVGCRGAMHG